MTRYEKRTARLIEMGKLVPLAPIREAFERLYAEGAMTQADVARHLGWFKNRSDARGLTQPDTTRFMRAIGARQEKSGRRTKHYVRAYTSPSNAERMVSALAAVAGLDPVDLGL